MLLIEQTVLLHVYVLLIPSVNKKHSRATHCYQGQEFSSCCIDYCQLLAIMVQFSDQVSVLSCTRRSSLTNAQYRASPSPLRSMEMNRSPDASGPLSPTLTLNSALQTTEFRNEQPLSRSNTKSSIVEKLSDTARNHFVAMVGEFVGTVLFLFFAFAGTQVANSVNTSSGKTLAETGSNPQQLLYISLCFGMFFYPLEQQVSD